MSLTRECVEGSRHIFVDQCTPVSRDRELLIVVHRDLNRLSADRLVDAIGAESSEVRVGQGLLGRDALDRREVQQLRHQVDAVGV